MAKHAIKRYVKCQKSGKYCDICNKLIKVGEYYRRVGTQKHFESYFHKKCEAF